MPEVPLIITVFDNINFGGSFRTIIGSLADFRNIEFNDRTSSVIVERGPNFQQGDAARLWDNINFAGPRITLTPGSYPDLRDFNFNDITSSLSIVRTIPPPSNIVAEDVQEEELRFNLRVIPPTGATLVSVDQNRILSPTASGRFVGDTGVIVIGSFIDELVTTILQSGVTRQATGRATITFDKEINFPEIAGLNKNNLTIRVTITNVQQSFTTSDNIVSKTVRFTLTTQVIRLLTTASLPADTYPIELK